VLRNIKRSGIIKSMINQLKKIPTETENEIMRDLFLAVYFNDLDKVVDFKVKYPEVYSKKDSFQLDSFWIEGKKTFDLKNLTFFNQTIWKDDDWIEETMPLVRRNRQRTEKMLDFWSTEFGNKNIKREIEYNQYCEYFFCADPNDPEANEEVIFDPISDYLKKGFREIDLRLYNRISCFDFAETKRLLEQGAKLDVNFDEGDESSNALSLVGSECVVLASCEVIPAFKRFEVKGYNQCFSITQIFRDLLGLAAFEDMYDLLEKYIEKG